MLEEARNLCRGSEDGEPHDPVKGLSLADRVGILRAGRLQLVGTPREIYENPINPMRRAAVRTN
jgi:ABC-type sugar transport system ATPase subunit